jgi:hypothetical protein
MPVDGRINSGDGAQYRYRIPNVHVLRRGQAFLKCGIQVAVPLKENFLEALEVQQRDNSPSFDFQGKSRQISLQAPATFPLVYRFRTMPSPKIFQHLVQKLSKVVGLLGRAHEDQRNKSGCLEEEVVKAKGSKVWCAAAVEELEEFEAKVRVER